MYRVMIVDDEVAIREKLPHAIDFAACGFAICATAKNGEEALALLPVHRPDLILLDIRMPVMDGITFLSKVRLTEFQDVQIIILSGYSDFTYAQKAMGHGVRAYLTKPVDEDEAASHLRALREILQARDRESARLQYRRELATLKRAYDVDGPIPALSGYALLHVLLKSIGQRDETPHPYQIITDQVASFAGMEDDALLYHRGSVYTFLLPAPLAGTPDENPSTTAETLLQALTLEGVECALLLDPYILGNQGAPLKTSLWNRFFAFVSPIFYDGAHYVQADRSYAFVETAGEALHAAYERLRRTLVDMALPHVEDAMTGLFDTVLAERPSQDVIYSLSDRIHYLLAEMMTTLHGSKENKPMFSRIEWKEHTFFLSYARWKTLQTQQITDALAFLSQNRAMLHMGVSRELLEYVYQHYRAPVTLKEVAEHFHMNAAYLGRVFQKATGRSYKQYVNNLRIAEAKRLLQNTDKLIYEIAEEVGFSESSYFISKFIRDTGMSPQEFRKH